MASALDRCAATTGVSVSDLLRTLLAGMGPAPEIGDLAHRDGHPGVVYRVARIAANRQQAFLEAAHGLHPRGAISSPGWTSMRLVGVLGTTD